MIDLDDLKFWYEKEEVDAYMRENQLPIEDVLQLLITNIRKYARVPVSHFQVGAGIYTHSGRIFLGTNIELYRAAINHTIHAEQCALSNMYLHTDKDGSDFVSILAVTEIPCGHCRQILQELPNAGNVRVIVKSKDIDCQLASLLPFSFELPIDGVVHHLFEVDRVVNAEQAAKTIPSIIDYVINQKTNLSLSKETWKTIITKAIELYAVSFCCYSGSGSVALFICADGRFAIGCNIESSAYNPTVNCGQMAVISCQVEQIEYTDIEMILMIESKDSLLTYKAFGNVLANTLNADHPIPFVHYEI